ncbi:myb domain protein 27 [Forsythia ovata]|uniref:Myb domain protein 27 n=1 Tax=Forsythia ovata TaxID=205694 RepID=A0ABD1WXE5_9LAMI
MHEEKLRKGPWLEEEEELLVAAVAILGERKWDALAKASGLRRSGKSCRLRWMNCLRPNLKHGHITAEEERVIIELHEKWGNKYCSIQWSRIVRWLPGRTDNEIKNYWRRSHFKKKLVVEKECDTATPSRIREYIFYNDDIFRSSFDSFEGLELWSLSLPYSPYETRLNEWMSNLSPEESKMETDDDFWNFDVSSPQWIIKDGWSVGFFPPIMTMPLVA